MPYWSHTPSAWRWLSWQDGVPGADLRGARFDRTTLTKTIFSRADLRECSFQRANFDRTLFDDATFKDLDAAG